MLNRFNKPLQISDQSDLNVRLYIPKRRAVMPSEPASKFITSFPQKDYKSALKGIDITTNKKLKTIKPKGKQEFNYPEKTPASTATLIIQPYAEREFPVVPIEASNRIICVDIPKGLSIQTILQRFCRGPLERIIIPSNQYPCLESSLDSKESTSCVSNFQDRKYQGYYTIELRFLESVDALIFYESTQEKSHSTNIRPTIRSSWANNPNRSIPRHLQDLIIRDGALRTLLMTARLGSPMNESHWELKAIRKDFSRFGTLESIIPLTLVDSNLTVVQIAINYTDIRFAIAAKSSFYGNNYWLKYRNQWSLEYRIL